MNTRTAVAATLFATSVGLLVASGCPYGTPANAILAKSIVGTWEIGEFFITFNSDGTYVTDFFGSEEGAYFVMGDYVVLDFGNGELQALGYIGQRDGKLLFVTNWPVQQYTPVE